MPFGLDLNSLYYMLKGEPGTRKSTQALSFPKPQYWFSYDRKMEALILPMQKWKIDIKDVDGDDYTDWDTAKNKLESLQVQCKYKTLIVDSITSMVDATNRQTRISKGAAGKKIGTISVDGLEEFNAESAAVSEMIALTKSIKKAHKINIVLIAHVIGVRKTDESNKNTQFSRIIMTGAEKISVKVASHCHETYHFDIERAAVVGQEGNYGLLTVHTGNDFARTCLGLDRRINFGDSPLYDTYIKPAIHKLQPPMETE